MYLLPCEYRGDIFNFLMSIGLSVKIMGEMRTFRARVHRRGAGARARLRGRGAGAGRGGPQRHGGATASVRTPRVPAAPPPPPPPQRVTLQPFLSSPQKLTSFIVRPHQILAQFAG